MQRRKRGLTAPGASLDAANVIPFPSGSRTPVRLMMKTEEQPCGTGADDTASSARRPAGTQSPPKHRPSQRGRNSIGVIVPGLTLPKELSGYRAPRRWACHPRRHRHPRATHLRTSPPVELTERVLDVTGALVNGDNVNRRRVLMLTAAGHTANYLRRYAPANPVGPARVRVRHRRRTYRPCMAHSDTGVVFFDEVKTHNRSIHELSSQLSRRRSGKPRAGWPSSATCSQVSGSSRSVPCT